MTPQETDPDLPRSLRPQLGHGELERHAAGLRLQGWDQQPVSQAEKAGKRRKGHGDAEG